MFFFVQSIESPEGSQRERIEVGDIHESLLGKTISRCPYIYIWIGFCASLIETLSAPARSGEGEKGQRRETGETRGKLGVRGPDE